MPRKRSSLAVAAFVAGVSIGACSSSGATSPGADPDAGAPDAGDAAPDGGSSSPDAGPITVVYGQCAFPKCGGLIIGTWHLTASCLSDQTFAPAKAVCPALKESNISMRATATLNVTATELQRTTAITFSGNIQMPKSCVPIGGATCDTVAAVLQNPSVFPGGFSFKNARCVENATDPSLCDCAVSTEVSDNVETTYTSTPDGTLTTPPPTGTSGSRTYEACATGSVLTFTETSKSQPLRLYGTFERP